MNRPQPDEFAPYYTKYIEKVNDDVLSELEKQCSDLQTFLSSIPHEKEEFTYAEGKWTTKEVIGHIIDTERIMAYRLLRISRNDSTPLPGFDENQYVKNSHFKSRDLSGLIDEFISVRKSNLHLFQSLNEDDLSKTGTASGYSVSVRALLFIIAGHVKHHQQILKERYLFY